MKSDNNVHLLLELSHCVTESEVQIRNTGTHDKWLGKNDRSAEILITVISDGFSLLGIEGVNLNYTPSLYHVNNIKLQETIDTSSPINTKEEKY